ncbi:hypothetical protein AGDE_13213 [Angomonas deanei]|nr:hypothetical protein AGDE_13213 [Angomonas deanei]|eukprot:EPY22615.1 hypothetical protein AGDE_13213 [Angomonas deanei]
MGQPVDQTEAYYLEKMLSSHETKENEANDSDEDEEERRQIQKEWNDQIEKTVLSKRNNTKLNTLHKVLQLSKKKDAHTILSNRHLRRLALGSGIELISISLPDIGLPPTLYRLQHLFLQEQTSPGSAVRPNETDFTFSSFHAHSLLLPIYAKQLVRQTPNTTRRNQRPVLLDRLDWVEGVCYSPGTEENSRALPPTDTPPNHKAVDVDNKKNVVYVFHRKVASLTPMEAYVLFGEASLHKDHYKWVFSVPIPPEFNDLRQQWYTAQQNEDSKEKKQIPIYFQPENCLSYHCHFCGREGHCWQQCDEYAMKDAESTLFLGEETPTGKAYHQLTADTDDNTSSVPPLSEEEFHKALLSHHQATDVLQAAKEQLTRGSDNNDYSVQDTVMITRDRHTQHAMRRETNTNNEDEVIIPVPNKAATIDYASSFKLRAESKKPSMHRRVLRCGYCSGKHHISQCPKLKQ